MILLAKFLEWEKCKQSNKVAVKLLTVEYVKNSLALILAINQ